MKHLTCLTIVLLMICQYSVIVNGEEMLHSGVCGDNLTWVLNAEGILTISGTGDMYDYESYSKAYGSDLPSLWWGKTLVGEQAPWKEYFPDIKSIVVEDGVTSIGDGAFISCPIVEIKLPSSIKRIGECAFLNCGLLQSVYMQHNVEKIEAKAFQNCTNIESITIPDSVKVINASTFYDCRELKFVVIGQSVEKICSSAFSGCYDLRNVYLPSSLNEIEIAAFPCNYLLTPFSYVENVENIFFQGNEEEWASLSIGTHNDAIAEAEVKFNVSDNSPFVPKYTCRDTEEYIEMGRAYIDRFYRVYGAFCGYEVSIGKYLICEELRSEFDYIIDVNERTTWLNSKEEKDLAFVDNPSFFGPEEVMTIYPSDWKIYMNGIEIKNCFNIGGYTLIDADIYVLWGRKF